MANILLNDGDDGDVFVYTGGDQQVPRDVRRVRIAENIDTIPARTFEECRQLIEVEGHNQLTKIEQWAFFCCRRLRWLTKMGGVKEIEGCAFNGCNALSDLEFDRLEIIGGGAFIHCTSLRSINLPSVRRVRRDTFFQCAALTEAVFGEDLGRIDALAFWICPSLRRIAIPLKDNLIIEDRAFYESENLSRVDIIGGIHKTISSFHMEIWRDEMTEEIDRINQTLPDTRSVEKALTMREWIRYVTAGMEYYKAEHQELLKEAMTLLELALWDANLQQQEERLWLKWVDNKQPAKKAKIDIDGVRHEARITSGASIVIKNVLPFLKLE